MRAKVQVATTLCLVLSIFALTGVSLAKSSPVVETEVEAELVPCCGDPEPDAEGEAERDTRTRNGVVQRDEFKAKVKVPVDPSSALGIIDQTTAENADIRLTLIRGDIAYAECALKFEEIEIEAESALNGDDDDDDDDDGEVEIEAEYKVVVRSRLRKGVSVLQELKGTCDTNLGTLGIQAGVPDVQDGDMARVRIVGTTDIDFLEGTFVED